LIILECPTSGHLTQFLNFLSNPHPLPAPLPPGINIDRCIKPRPHEDETNEQPWLAVLNVFPTLSCTGILFKLKHDWNTHET
jgi:hypothetical protein